MAAATAVFTLSAWPKGIDMTQRRFILYGSVAVSATASGYLNGGIPITIATATASKISSPVAPASAASFVWPWIPLVHPDCSAQASAIRRLVLRLSAPSL